MALAGLPGPSGRWGCLARVAAAAFFWVSRAVRKLYGELASDDAHVLPRPAFCAQPPLPLWLKPPARL